MNEWSLSERLSLWGCWRRLGWGARGAGVISLGLVFGWGLLRGVGVTEATDEILGVGLAFWGWVVAVAVAVGLPAWGYAVAGWWLVWHGLALMGAWTGTPMVAVPVVWWLWTGLAVVAWTGPRRALARGGIWAAMALGAGFFLAGPVGWSRLPGPWGEMIWLGRLGLAGVIWWGGWQLLPRLRSWEWTEPEFGRVWVLGLVVMGVGGGVALGRDAEATAGWARSVLEAGRWWGMMGWFWAGGLFGLGMVRFSEKGWSDKVGNRGGGTAWSAGLVLVWLGVTVAEWLAGHEVTGGWMGRYLGGLRSWVETWPGEVRLVAGAHAWVGVVVVVLGLGFLWQGQGMRPGWALRRLHAVWVVSLGALVLVGPALPGSAGEGRLIFEWAPMWLLVIGWLATVVGLLRQVAAGAGKTGARWDSRPWGVVLLMAGWVLAEGNARGLPWGQGGGTAALLGLLHVSAPLLLYEWWRGPRSSGERLALSTQGWIFALGLLGVLPLLHRDAFTVSQMAFCPFWWLVILWGLKGRNPRLETPEGALAGALLGSATVAAWCRPHLLLPEVPVFAKLNPPVLADGGGGFSRPYFDAPHFTLWLLMTLLGALLGATIFRGLTADGLPVAPVLADDLEATTKPILP